MSITVEWDNSERTVVRWTFVGKWDWDDFKNAQSESKALIQSVTHVVDVIGDVSQSSGLPPNAFARYRTFLQNRPANAGQVMLIGSSRFIQTAIRTFQKIYPAEHASFGFADSLDEARAWLADSRQRGDNAMV